MHISIRKTMGLFPNTKPGVLVGGRRYVRLFPLNGCQYKQRVVPLWMGGWGGLPLGGLPHVADKVLLPDHQVQNPSEGGRS